MKTLYFLLILCLLPQTFAAISFCEKLDEDSFTCFEHFDPKTCESFVRTFEKLLPQEIKTCGERKGGTPIDLHYDRLARLPFKSAIALYTSEKLRSSMDGHVAELHRKRSLADANRSIEPTTIDPTCRAFEELTFKAVSGHEEATIDGFIVWDGDAPSKIVNTKTKNECTVRRPGLVDSITKVKGRPLLRYKFSEAGKSWDTFIDPKTCEKVYETTWGAAETISGEDSHVFHMSTLRKVWPSCAKCWNKDFEACLRRF